MGVTEDEMVGWYHRLNGHEFEQTWGDSDVQRSLICCSSWDRKESDNSVAEQNSFLMKNFHTYFLGTIFHIF